jgi:hypothetical protein
MEATGDELSPEALAGLSELLVGVIENGERCAWHLLAATAYCSICCNRCMQLTGPVASLLAGTHVRISV